MDKWFVEVRKFLDDDSLEYIIECTEKNGQRGVAEFFTDLEEALKKAAELNERDKEEER